jgi:hypothetical protein
LRSRRCGRADHMLRSVKRRVRSLALRVAPGLVGNKPNFLGIGAAKAGTSSVAQLLASHPDIGFPRDGRKEMHFFDYPEKITPKGIREYFGMFPGNKARGEYTPSYLFMRECRDHIRTVLGADVRFIVALRNPVDRAFSHYCHAVNNWGEKVWRDQGYPEETLSFEEALEQEDRRLKEGRYHIRHLSYFRKGLYAEQLKWYFESFPRESFYVYLLDDFGSAPRRILREISRFLEVDDDFEFRGVDDRWNAQTNRPMDPETRARLVEQYRASIEELEELLGRDLSRWKR